jgi:hypothetical protein
LAYQNYVIGGFNIVGWLKMRMNWLFWHPTKAWKLSERVEIPRESLAERQNEIKDFVVLSVI